VGIFNGRLGQVLTDLSSPGRPFEIYKQFFKIFAFFLLVAFSDFYEPTVSEVQRVGTFDKLSVKAPRRPVPSAVERSKRAAKRQALPLRGFLLLTG
jgi:hypothetical protein